MTQETTGKSVKDLIKKLESKIDSSKIINVKYIEQNFHMCKELKLLEKKDRTDNKKSK